MARTFLAQIIIVEKEKGNRLRVAREPEENDIRKINEARKRIDGALQMLKNTFEQVLHELYP